MSAAITETKVEEVLKSGTEKEQWEQQLVNWWSHVSGSTTVVHAPGVSSETASLRIRLPIPSKSETRHLIFEALHDEADYVTDGKPVCDVRSPDMVTSLHRRLGYRATALSGGEVTSAAPLHLREQGRSYRCVASSFATAMYFRALFQCDKAQTTILASRVLRPSVAHMYHTQREMECRDRANSGKSMHAVKGRSCDCGPKCGGICDDVGTLNGWMHLACEAGVVCEKDWPHRYGDDRSASLSNASKIAQYVKESHSPSFMASRPYYRLTLAKALPLVDRTSATISGWIRHSLKFGEPCVISLRRFPNQVRWFHSQDALSEHADTPYDVLHLLPRAEGASHNMSHAVIIVGYDADSDRFRVRNSRGSAWGCGGEFSMAASYMSSHQILDATVIMEVQICNRHLLCDTPVPMSI